MRPAHTVSAGRSRRGLLLLPLFLLAAFPAGSRAADVADILNTVRAQGCGGKTGIATPLRKERSLAAAARQLARGASLDDALIAAGYRARRSASLRLSGNLGEEAVVRTVRTRFCAESIDPEFRDIGVHEGRGELWLIVAMPLGAPSEKSMPEIGRRVLELTNEARAHGRLCGNTAFSSARPLKLDNALSRAALEHARDLASRSVLSHEGANGSTPIDRVAATGYRWRRVGENVAAGPVTAEEVTEGWLDSPHHCSNIMDPRFSEMGIAYAVDPKSKSVIYWTQVFAQPR